MHRAELNRCARYRSCAVNHHEIGTHRHAEHNGWDSVPFYAVGQKTAFILRSIRRVAKYDLSPSIIRGDDMTGTSERLAHFIVHDTPNRRASGALLELVGDKNKDTQRVVLRNSGVVSQELQVYRTQPSTKFYDDLHALMQVISTGSYRFQCRAFSLLRWC